MYSERETTWETGNQGKLLLRCESCSCAVEGLLQLQDPSSLSLPPAVMVVNNCDLQILLKRRFFCGNVRLICLYHRRRHHHCCRDDEEDDKEVEDDTLFRHGDANEDDFIIIIMPRNQSTALVGSTSQVSVGR